MRKPASTSFILALAILTALPIRAHAQIFPRTGAVGTLPTPVILDATGKFQARFARLGDDLFIAGQPTEAGLRELKAQGVTTVVNLRSPPEMAKVGFDEAALVKELGMTYVYLPVRGDTAFPYAPSTVTKFNEALKSAKGKVLLHCTVAWRASHLWGAYLIAERHVDIEAALANARAIGLDDANRMMAGQPQPIEEFLGRKLPTLGQRKQ